MTSISKTFSNICNFLEIPEILYPIKVVGTQIDKIVGPFAKWGSRRGFDAIYRVSRLPFSIITFSNALGKEFGIERLSVGMPYLGIAAANKNFWAASRIVEQYDEFHKNFTMASCENQDKYNETSSSVIALRRIYFVAQTLSAISENADFWGANRITAVANMLNTFSQTPVLSFGLSSFGHGDQFFKAISLTLSLVNDGVTIYNEKARLSKENGRAVSIWETAMTSKEVQIRKILIDKIGKLFLITFAGTLVPEWNRTRTWHYCAISFVVDLSGVYGVWKKGEEHIKKINDDEAKGSQASSVSSLRNRGNPTENHVNGPRHSTNHQLPLRDPSPSRAAFASNAGVSSNMSNELLDLLKARSQSVDRTPVSTPASSPRSRQAPSSHGDVKQTGRKRINLYQPADFKKPYI